MACHRLIAVLLGIGLSLAAGGCAGLPSRTGEGLASLRAQNAPQPGTPEWWKKHQRKAELVPGEGFRVAGVPGYFDAQGRPMEAPMSEQALVLESGEPKEDEGLFPGLDPSRHVANVKQAVGLGPSQQKAQVALEEGERLYANKQYKAAAKQFKEAAARWPDSVIEQRALYMEANSYFFDDRYSDAREAYVRLMEKHPNSPNMDSAVERLWAIGQYWEEYDRRNPSWPTTPNLVDKSRPWFDTLGYAIKAYENIQLYDPTGPRADDAIMATAGIHFRRGRYTDADYYYKLLREEYPRSDFQFEAHLLGLQAKMRRYQGPDYDGTPLEEAQKLAKQLHSQFAGRLTAEEKDRLTRTRSELVRAIAERDLSMAQHYEKTKHYQSARYYYQQIAQNYPDTPLAGEARTRLAQIADEPDAPEERLAWLVDMFPENPERSRVARVTEIPEQGTRVADRTGGEGTTPADGNQPFDPTSTR